MKFFAPDNLPTQKNIIPFPSVIPERIPLTVEDLRSAAQIALEKAQAKRVEGGLVNTESVVLPYTPVGRSDSLREVLDMQIKTDNIAVEHKKERVASVSDASILEGIMERLGKGDSLPPEVKLLNRAETLRREIKRVENNPNSAERRKNLKDMESSYKGANLVGVDIADMLKRALSLEEATISQNISDVLREASTRVEIQIQNTKEKIEEQSNAIAQMEEVDGALADKLFQELKDVEDKTPPETIVLVRALHDIRQETGSKGSLSALGNLNTKAPFNLLSKGGIAALIKALSTKTEKRVQIETVPETEAAIEIETTLETPKFEGVHIVKEGETEVEITLSVFGKMGLKETGIWGELVRRAAAQDPNNVRPLVKKTIREVFSANNIKLETGKEISNQELYDAFSNYLNNNTQ